MADNEDTRQPAMMFYVGDWMRDPAVRSVSLAARGLWFDMLCLMHQSPRRGYLEHATGRPVTRTQIARMVGASPEEADALLGELEDCGVCSIAESGAYFSRRMARDAEISRVRSEAGRRGGQRTQAKFGRSEANRQANRQATPQASREAKPEAKVVANPQADEQTGKQSGKQSAEQTPNQKPSLSIAVSTSSSTPSVREGTGKTRLAPEAVVVPALPETGGGGDQNSPTARRDPERPAGDCTLEDWREACRMADRIETDLLSPSAWEARTNRRAMACAAEVERRRGDWAEAHAIIDLAIEHMERDDRLAKIVGGLRRHADGILASVGPNGRGPCRLDYAKRVLLELRLWPTEPPRTAQAASGSTFEPLPLVRL